MINPLNSPKSQIPELHESRGGFSHRRCPSCYDSLPWSRFWLPRWYWKTFPCLSCKAILKFSRPRHFAAMAVCVVLMIGLQFAINRLENRFPEFLEQPWQMLILMLFAMPVMLIEGVVINDG